MADFDSDPAVESHSLRGPADRAALLIIRDIFATEEPLATPELDDYLNPTELEITLADGIGSADAARIDVVWTTRGDYKFHYTDAAGVNARWGRHPHGGEYDAGGLAHFHPPPGATSDSAAVEPSCIDHTVERLVARAVNKLWRAAYEASDTDLLNAAANPP